MRRLLLQIKLHMPQSKKENKTLCYKGPSLAARPQRHVRFYLQCLPEYRLRIEAPGWIRCSRPKKFHGRVVHKPIVGHNGHRHRLGREQQHKLSDFLVAKVSPVDGVSREAIDSSNQADQGG